MYKFQIYQKKYDISVFKIIPMFDELFEYICSGRYNEDIPNIPDDTKIGYIINFESNIDLDDNSKFKEFVLNFDECKNLFNSSYFDHKLNIKYNGEIKSFRLNIVIDSWNLNCMIGIPLTINYLKNLFTGKIEATQTVRSCLFASDLGDKYTQVIDMCKFDYYKNKI